MNEYGRIGQRRWEGQFAEEFLPELSGMRGIRVYREMSDNDDTIGAILFAIKMVVRQVKWHVEPGGGSAADKEAAEFVESCMYDMQSTWTDLISEILSFLTYGWSFHEIVYKRRNGKSKNRQLSSKYSDGLIGWQKIAPRAQDTLFRWEYDDKDNLLGMTQQPPPDYGLLTIPIQKAMLFRTESIKDNPEGRSILRNAYRSWYFKRRIQEIEAIGIERDLAGLPVIYGKEDVDLWDDSDQDMKNTYASLVAMVKNIRRNESEGLVLPEGYKVELLSTGGARQFDTNAIINRYDTKMAQTVLADFIMLGHEKTGSFALSSDKTQLFSSALAAFLDVICETFNNQGIPTLIDINGEHFKGITDYPQLAHGDIDKRDITKLSTYLKDLVGAGILIPDDTLEDYVRDAASLPERSDFEDTRVKDERREAQRRAPEKTVDEPGGDPEVDPEENQEQVEEAKKRLGR